MKPKTIVLIGTAAALLIIVIAVLVVVLTRDEATSRYDGMAIALEDYCKQALGEPIRCAQQAECYRDGIEAVLPRDLISIEDYEDLPESVRKAMEDLVRRCAAEAGLPTN